MHVEFVTSVARPLSVACALFCSMPLHAQSRGVYPLGMSATNSGVTGEAGFTYSNQLLFYSRDASKDEHGDTVATGNNAVLMDLNSLVWVSRHEILGGARYSATVTLPVARNELTSDIHGNISGGSGFADSYYLPFILGWNKDRAAVRVLYGFLAPTGRFAPGGTSNVGSGYWTSTISSGQTFYLTDDKQLNASAFEMYEFHTTQEGTGTKPGDTFNVDYSVMQTLRLSAGAWRLHVGLVGYEQRQTTAKTGPSTSPEQSRERYTVHAVGVGSSATFPAQSVSLGLRFFKEFASRSTFEGFSLQVSGAIGF
jgi:hypothetical protein